VGVGDYISYIDLTGYSSVADMNRNIVFGTSETERMRIIDNGNVGIGTTVPATALEVNGDIGIGRVAGGYTFREVVGGGVRATIKSNATNDLILSTGGDSEALRILTNGNVGIGTTDPDSKLNMKSGVFLAENQASTNGMVLYYDAGGSGGDNNNQYTIGNAKLGVAQFVNDTGTTGSTITLMNKELANNTTKHASIGFVNTDTAGNGKFGGQIGFWPEDGNASKQQFRIYTSGTSSGYNLPVQRMVVDGDGKVGIGTTDPISIFHTHGGELWDGSSMASKVCATLSVARGGGAGGTPSTVDTGTGAIMKFTHDGSLHRHVTIESVSEGPYSGQIGIRFKTLESGNTTAPLERMRISGTGRVGIGTTSPQAKLHVYPTNTLNTEIQMLNFAPSFTEGYLGISATSTMINAVGADLRFKGRVYVSPGVGQDHEVMCLKPNGEIGIGTDSPDGLLDILGPADEGQHKLRLRDSNTNLTFRVGLKAGTSGYQNGWTTIDPNGGGGLAIYDVVYVAGTLSVSSTKNFLIDHPLQPTTKKLIHTAVESPRVDLIYRGTTQLKDGRAIVNIDRQCVGDESCAMEDGTFEALCRDPVYYLQNTTDFNRLIGTIDKNLLTIISEDVNSIAIVNWMVVAERKDRDIVEATQTNDNGRLNTEIIDTSERVNRDGSARYSSA
jgi:hypothetical protein